MADALKLMLPDAPPKPPESIVAYKTELDDRCLLFPDGKMMSHLVVTREGERSFGFDAVFVFNRTRTPSRFLVLTREELQPFVRELAESVYAAKSGFVLQDTLKISITVLANGYRIEFQRSEQRTELFLSTGVIWRVIKTLLIAVDEASPVVSH
jgi:hypothetical protein